MPQQRKHASSGHLARQAKKRKRSQREDPVYRAGKKHSRLKTTYSERRQEGREHDAASRRQARQQNPDRRLDEQQRNTIGTK